MVPRVYVVMLVVNLQKSSGEWIKVAGVSEMFPELEARPKQGC